VVSTQSTTRYKLRIFFFFFFFIKIKEIPFVLIFNTLILDRNQSDLRRP
jgi:hypothetical protein